MSALATLLRWDLALQYRHGFWASGLAIGLVWGLLLRPLPADLQQVWLPCVLYFDIGIIGLMFIAGILFFERRQGATDALVVTPMPTRSWLASKVLALSALATFAGGVVVLLTLGLRADWLWLAPSLALVAALYTLFGFLMAARFQGASGFMVSFGFFGLPMALPVLDYFEIWGHPLLWLNPAHPTLVLVRHPFRPASALEVGLAFVLTLIWIAVAFHLGERSFHRRVSWRRGAA